MAGRGLSSRKRRDDLSPLSLQILSRRPWSKYFTECILQGGEESARSFLSAIPEVNEELKTRANTNRADLMFDKSRAGWENYAKQIMKPLFQKSITKLFFTFIPIIIALMVSAQEGSSPEWNVQDTIMYIPDPVLEDMGQGQMVSGAMVYAYVKNTSTAPMSLARIKWDGKDLEELAETPPYPAVWRRLNPQTVPPGGLGEIALRLRKKFPQSRKMEIFFTNGKTVELSVEPRPPDFRLKTLSVASNRRHVFIYVEQESGNEMPETILLDGSPVAGTVTWLSDGYTGAAGEPHLRAAVVELNDELIEGAWHTWTVKGRGSQASTTLRVIPEPVAFGIAGTADFERLSRGGLDALYSFHFLEEGHLDKAAALGMRVILYEHPHEFPDYITHAHQAHPGLMGYNIFDEPDVHDDIIGRIQDRPWSLRVGIKAPEMVKLIQDTATASPRAPVFMTLNMTFFPGNYYTYGPIADIMTTDFYPITHGRSVGDIRIAAEHTRRGTAPRPFGFIYQCNREDWSSGNENAPPYNGYAGRDDILSRGFDFFRDDARTRGFARPPAGGEVELQIAYLLGEGAKSFWGYADATECIGSHGILYTGARDLPEVWNAQKAMFSALAHVKTEIGIAHPIVWTAADKPGILVRTLIAGRDSALVVAINENYRSVKEGFFSTPVESLTFTFPDLPWLKAGKVERITPGGFVPLATERTGAGSIWKLPKIENTAIFRIGRK